MRIHPVLDACIPRMPQEDLNALAESVRAYGLLVPLIVDADGVLLDGRERLDACQRAGVEPRYTVYDGQDPIGTILSVNSNRVHRSKGQLAIFIARAFSSPDTHCRCATCPAAPASPATAWTWPPPSPPTPPTSPTKSWPGQ